MELEIGTRLLTAIGVLTLGVLVERWWNYVATRRR